MLFTYWSLLLLELSFESEEIFGFKTLKEPFLTTLSAGF